MVPGQEKTLRQRLIERRRLRHAQKDSHGSDPSAGFSLYSVLSALLVFGDPRRHAFGDRGL